jgi:ribosome-binding factor A
MKQRTDRLNSLLKEVISEVIKRDVKNPHVSELVTVTQVDISKDLHHAKVYISVIGNELTRQDTLLGLEASAGFIGYTASKKVVLRYFPTLQFILDDGVNQHMRIEELLHEISEERAQRDDEIKEETKE